MRYPIVARELGLALWPSLYTRYAIVALALSLAALRLHRLSARASKGILHTMAEYACEQRYLAYK